MLDLQPCNRGIREDLRHVYRHSFPAMGTTCHLIMPGVAEHQGRQVADRVIRTIGQVEDILSIFRPDSDLSRLNEACSKPGVYEIGNPLLAEVLANCRLMSDATQGFFEVSHLSERDAHCCYDIDTAKRQIATTKANICFDLGGIGKGVALDKARDCLRQLDVQCALISLGQSSIAVLGQYPGGTDWPIAVRHPVRRHATLRRFKLTESSISVSSTALNGIAGSGSTLTHVHITDPDTGRPIVERLCVIVVAASATVGDAFGTALLVATAGGKSIPVPDGIVHGSVFALDAETHGVREIHTHGKPHD